MEIQENTGGKVSHLLNRLSESATLAMARIGRELAEKGYDVISLSLGEPDFDTPDFIKEAAKQAIDDNYTHYPPVNGYAPLRKAISNKLLRDNNLNYSPDQIVVSTGAKQSLANAILSLVNPGDEVILPAPYWVTYEELIKLAGGKPVVIKTTVENDFKITAEELKDAMTEKSKLMIYSSPCNPSGSVYSRDELASLAEVIKEHPNFYVISDEIYELINFTGEHASLAQFEDIYGQVITINGVSKAFAMTGWRIGYMAAPLWIAKACTKMQGQFTSAASGISQMAAKAAVEADPSSVDFMKAAFKKRRKLVLDLMDDIPGLKNNVPEGAFYVFPDVSDFFGKSCEGYSINSPTDLTNYLLETEYVALVTGEAFGDPNCVRLSYAASEIELTEALSRIKRALAKLQ